MNFILVTIMVVSALTYSSIWIINQYTIPDKAYALTTNQSKNPPSTTGDSLIIGGTTTLRGNQTIILAKRPPLQNVSYIQVNFKLANESELKTDAHGGIVWTNGDNRYYAFVRPSSGLLSIYTPESGEFLHSEKPQIVKNTWYTLRIVFHDDAIDVYMNNTPPIHIEQSAANTDISNIGIRSFNTIATFVPLKLAGNNNIAYSDSRALPWLRLNS
jgi:hypothetical protein